MTENDLNNEVNLEVISQNDIVPAGASKELAPLTTDSLSCFTVEEQESIMELSSQIDPTQLEKVMSYGSIPLIRSFEQAGKLLQAEAGSSADQEVIKEVMALAKQASDSYDDFNLALQEPSLLQKFLLKLSPAARKRNEADVKFKAISNYKLLEQLATSCDGWLAMLQEGWVNIHESADQDRQNCIDLEKYIVAGRIAEERIRLEVEDARLVYEASGTMATKEAYEKMLEGYETFQLVLLNLEKSRAAFVISIGQLSLQSKANTNAQIAVREQKTNTMAVCSQQLRNAVLNAQTRQAVDGQKTLALLNDELMKKVSEDTVLTAEESEKILLNGVYSVEAALVAAKTVIDGCASIEKAHAARAEGIAEQLDNLQTLLTEIAPFVSRIKPADPESLPPASTTSPSTSGLSF